MTLFSAGTKLTRCKKCKKEFEGDDDFKNHICGVPERCKRMKCRKCGRIGIGEFSRNPFNKTDLCSKCFEKEARK